MALHVRLVGLLLCLIHLITSQQPSYLSGPLKTEFLPSLSPCCTRLNNRCQRAKMACYDFIKPPFLLLTCRCRVTIRQEYERYRKQCMRDAVDFFLEKLEEEDRRTIIGHLPGHTNKFPGKPATSGARGPKDRGQVNLSEDYLKRKNQEFVEKQKAKESAMTGDDDVIDDDQIFDERTDREAIIDTINSKTDPDLSLNSDESLIDNMAYMKA